MFIGNAGGGGHAPSIVELDVHGNLLGTYSVSAPASESLCAATTLTSLDVSADGNSVFFTAGDNTIRQVSGLPCRLPARGQ